MSDDDWLNNGLPFIDHVFDGKTGRQIARENMKQWARDGRWITNGLNVKWITHEEMLREWPDK